MDYVNPFTFTVLVGLLAGVAFGWLGAYLAWHRPEPW